MIKHALMPFSLAVALLGGCSSDGGDDSVPDAGSGSGSGSGNTAIDTSGDTTVDESEVPETLVEGTWESECLPASGTALGRQFVISVQEGDEDLLFRYFDTSYGDTACSEGSAQLEVETLGTFREQLFEAGQDLADGIPIDISVGTVLLRPRLRQVADDLNTETTCGLSNWEAGVDQDISGCETLSNRLDVSTEAPRTDFNRFLVDDNGSPAVRSDDRLFLGTLNAQTDPAERPTTVNREVGFRRRPGTAFRPGDFDAGL